MNELIEKNLEFLTTFTKLYTEDESLRKRLPNDFRLLHLPLNDDKLLMYNLKLERKYRDNSKPLVVAYVSDNGMQLRIETARGLS